MDLRSKTVASARGLVVTLGIAGISLPGPVLPALAATGPGEYRWPVVGAVLAPFDPPDSPFGRGHRGIDIAALVGTTVVAPAEGRVAFAGPVGGSLFVTLDHGGGIETTYSWLSALLVRKGDVVVPGTPIARSGWGHALTAIPHLHLGAKIDGEYVDPLSLLGPLPLTELLRLAPLLDATDPAA